MSKGKIYISTLLRDEGGRIDQVEILDTTLRDGGQTRGVTFTLRDKLSLVKKLDELGVKYIEAGWPGSNPKDLTFFKVAKDLELENSEIVAFGSTVRKGVRPSKDISMRAFMESGVKTAVIFGKSWLLHVDKVLKVTPEDNLELIRQTVGYLKDRGLNVIYDAEHFFDGYKDDADYTMSTIEVAEGAGADVIALADTNGGSMPWEVEEITKEAMKSVKRMVGIHAHNDAGMGVSNTLAAVRAGARHVQGTLNGLGERCGNADLCQVLPDLVFKMGFEVLEGDSKKKLKGLKVLSSYVYELLNLRPNSQQPYVGDNAFAHKGGVHVDAVLKERRAYEHIDPSLVGNRRKISVSELSGKAVIVNEARKLGLKLDKHSEVVGRILNKVKKLESEGYHLENANATVHILMLEELGHELEPFKLQNWVVVSSNWSGASADVLVKVGDEWISRSGEGVGPVHAVDVALKKALSMKFKILKKVELVNYKVSVIDGVSGTASKVRVFTEFQEGGRRWATTWVAPNIIDASCKALADGYVYRLVAEGLKAV